MVTLTQQRTQKYIHARQQHPAWLLLASRRAPLMLSGLDALFEHQRDGVPFDLAVQTLADLLAAHANQPDFDIDPTEVVAQARRELREWVRRGLVTEREGRVHETDALKTALRFVSQLDQRLMTSTASRLALVQQQIDQLAAALNPDPQTRAQHLERRIQDLQQQLADVQAGRVPTLTTEQAVEGIRDMYALATSLRADFRRVEDSWREADRNLRQAILSAQHDRGEVMEQLLQGHASLLNTAEGRVFENFQQQLDRHQELDDMSAHIRAIVVHPAAAQALDDLQRSELQLLRMQLIKEAKVVQAVRARSEREVGQFMKTGQAAENQRVGQLLNDVLQQALHIDWQRQATRRQPAPLPPLGLALAGLPLIERLRIKSLEGGGEPDLLLTTQYTHLDQVDDEFWQAFEGLDRPALLAQTLDVLQHSPQPLTLGDLAQTLPPGDHDLETLTLWLALAREAALPLDEHSPEHVTLTHQGQPWHYTVPRVALTAQAVQALDASDF
jgi:polyhydroxyalkanoate synthesis regulator phasin